MSTSRRVLVAAVAVLVVIAANSPVLFASHSWGNYHWARTANPFTLKVGNNVTSPGRAISTRPSPIGTSLPRSASPP